MVFKRRNPRTWGQAFAHAVYPRGGWYRAGQYIVHRLRRLPDPAHKISRGIAAGVFASFTPFFGFHFVTAALIAWAMRGNILAAMLATFFGNPLTFPVIATVSVELGTAMLGQPAVPPADILISFTLASVAIWKNFVAIFTVAPFDWSNMTSFLTRIFLPYLVGGIAPGVVTGLVAYILANPVIASYQRGRIRRLRERFEARRRLAEAQKARARAAAEAKKADAGSEPD